MARYRIKAKNREEFGELLEFLSDCSVEPHDYNENKFYVIVTSKQLSKDELGMLGESFSVSEDFSTDFD